MAEKTPVDPYLEKQEKWRNTSWQEDRSSSVIPVSTALFDLLDLKTSIGKKQK